MSPPYSSHLFAPTHPANQPTPAPQCCLDAHQSTDYIRCATCYKHKPQHIVEDDWSEESPVRVNQQLPINHKISDDFEGPLWQ